jgi:hypothetical protein
MMGMRPAAEQTVALDRAAIAVFRGILFFAAGPASERSRSPHTDQVSTLGR